MGEQARYPVPADFVRVEDVISRSRFITTLVMADTRESALSFVDAVKEEFADATHNCWAYLVGPPGTMGCVGVSDDGEPHGTAGKPMLNVLMHSGLGDVAVVVTRYYGGQKLGRGGLVRAYSGGVKRAVDQSERAEKVAWVRGVLTLDYTYGAPLKQLYPQYEVELLEEDFTDRVTHFVRLPAENMLSFQNEVFNLTNGRVKVKLLESSEEPEL
jgi:uncharacterized YigZ family protein